LQESASKDEGTVPDFLRALTSELPAQNPIHIPKKELLKRICAWRSCNLKDAEILLEDWESVLRKTILVDDWAVLYNLYSERLVIEQLPTDGQIARSVELRSNNIRNSLHETLLSLPPAAFENLLANVFSRVPWARDVRVTQRSRDGGIDFVGRYLFEEGDEVPLFGQAKHWRDKLDAPHVQGFIGSLTTHSRGKPIVGIIYCTAGFSGDAEAEIRRSPIKILQYDENRLIELMLRHEVGVSKMRIESFSLDGRFWDEIEE
jgi:restriction endonuclease Mrr